MTAEIAASGPMPFVRFMDLALYHPQFGYYMRPPESGAERIGSGELGKEFVIADGCIVGTPARSPTAASSSRRRPRTSTSS